MTTKGLDVIEWFLHYSNMMTNFDTGQNLTEII